MKETIINGVKVIEYDDGTTHFEPIEELKPEIPKKQEPEGFFAKIWNWFTTSDVTPYVKSRDLADPFGDRKNDSEDIDAGSDGKQSIEVGLRFRF